MKYIYHCYGGAHSSVTAAAIHLGLLPRDRAPTADDLLRLAYFDRHRAPNHGRIYFMGRDDQGNEVYTLGRRNLGPITERVLTGIARVYGLGPEDVRLVNTMSCVNWKMIVGGFNSRVLGAVTIGRPIVTAGTLQAIPKLTALVEAVRRGEAGHLIRGDPGGARQVAKPRIFYCCYGSAHSSVVTAAIHLGRLPGTGPPPAAEIIGLPLFDRVPHRAIGRPLFVGVDRAGFEVFVLGMDGGRGILNRTIPDFLNLFGLNPGAICLRDTLPAADVLVRVGGFLSRRLGMVWPGRYIAASGIRRSYARFAAIAHRAREELWPGDSRGASLDGPAKDGG